MVRGFFEVFIFYFGRVVLGVFLVGFYVVRFDTWFEGFEVGVGVIWFLRVG